ncbi:MAG: DUF1269 domain-containing protein [Arenicellales bacterium]
MSKYIVAVFPNESAAYEGMGALKALHNEGSLSLYGVAVMAKDVDGNVSVREEQDEGPMGAALGMLTGALVGALVGPAGAAAGAAAGSAAAAGMAIGATSGGLLGSLVDVNNVGVGLDFLELVGDRMEAGTAAVVSEVDEYWTAPLDTRIEALGGEVFRRTRTDFEDEQFAQEVQAWNDELDALEAEIKEASDEMKARLEAKKDAVRKSLEEAKEKGNNKVSQLENELKTKVAELEKQSADAKAESKAKIDSTIAKVKAGYTARISKLKEAGSLIKEALS